MYSTNMKNNRYLAECLLVSRTKYVTFERFVIDTGAKFTCCNYKIVDKALEEKQLSNCEKKLIDGFVKGEYLKFDKFYLHQFTIGNIDMGGQYIWITFDERITDIILGMDILKQVILTTNPYNQRIYFCRDAKDYHRNFELIAK